jgi:cell division protein FtsL
MWMWWVSRCFHCHHCATPLTAATFRVLDKELYCTPHYNLIAQLGADAYRALRTTHQAPLLPPAAEVARAQLLRPPTAAAAVVVPAIPAAAEPAPLVGATVTAVTVDRPPARQDHDAPTTPAERTAALAATTVDLSREERRELSEIEQRQVTLQARGVVLEQQLRTLMADEDAAAEEEERLMAEWFALISERNALVRREEALRILYVPHCPS